MIDVERNGSGGLQLHWQGYEAVKLLEVACHDMPATTLPFQRRPAEPVLPDPDDISWDAHAVVSTKRAAYSLVTPTATSRVAATALGRWFGQTLFRGHQLSEFEAAYLPIGKQLVSQINLSAECQAAGIRAEVPRPPAPAHGWLRQLASVFSEFE